MKIVVAVLSAVAVSTAATAAPQGNIGPFVGDEQETFESIPVGEYTSFRVFGDRAELRHVIPTPRVRVTDVPWTDFCSIDAYEGVKFAGVTWQGTQMTIEFDTPVLRFGGYFGTNTGVQDGRIAFYGPGDGLLTVKQIDTNSCFTWKWNGWEASGVPFQRVRIRSDYDAGQMMMVDALEADYAPPCAPFLTYCTAKTALVCGPAKISGAGWPSAIAQTGFLVRAQPVQMGRFGMLVYTDQGRAAVPFDGGFLCIPPTQLRRATGWAANGSPGCGGYFWNDVNAFAHGLYGGNPAAFLRVPGTRVNVQFWGRDSLATGSVLSDALEYEVCAQ